jgi:hypothetical protein
LPYTGGYQQCERELVASLESPLIYNELHERIAFVINHLFPPWNWHFAHSTDNIWPDNIRGVSQMKAGQPVSERIA